jgi:hypothetical protein
MQSIYSSSPYANVQRLIGCVWNALTPQDQGMGKDSSDDHTVQAGEICSQREQQCNHILLEESEEGCWMANDVAVNDHVV